MVFYYIYILFILIRVRNQEGYYRVKSYRYRITYVMIDWSIIKKSWFNISCYYIANFIQRLFISLCILFIRSRYNRRWSSIKLLATSNSIYYFIFLIYLFMVYSQDLYILVILLLLYFSLLLLSYFTSTLSYLAITFYCWSVISSSR